MNITLLGAGAWGTALAIALSRRHPVMLWSRDAQAVEAMRGERQNQRKSCERTAPRIARPRSLVRQVEDARGGAWVHGGNHRRFAEGYPREGQAERGAKRSASRLARRSPDVPCGITSGDGGIECALRATTAV